MGAEAEAVLPVLEIQYFAKGTNLCEVVEDVAPDLSSSQGVSLFSLDFYVKFVYFRWYWIFELNLVLSLLIRVWDCFVSVEFRRSFILMFCVLGGDEI